METHGLKGRLQFCSIVLDFILSGKDRNDVCLTIVEEVLETVVEKLKAVQVEDNNG